MVLVSVVGIAGLQSVMDALQANRQVLLANKEALVTGGHLVMDAARKIGKPLLPVDSEHSAIFQCLEAAMGNRPASVILTASGGPFRGYSLEQLENVTLAQALAHPNWSMGRKITVDSASMVNKCLEIIEAKHLFNMAPSEIEVVVHPQSIVHSMVRFTDGAVLAQLGTPDMRVPIAYALDWPKRDTTGAPRLDFAALTGGLTFEVPDTNVFRTIPLAYESLERGGTATAALNGANEVLVAAFLAEKIRFIDIQNTLLKVMDRYENTALNTIEDVFAADAAARRMTEEVLSSL
jgi:1-deoxy-D-xylulose-5-phosphate reductoisomerase